MILGHDVKSRQWPGESQQLSDDPGSLRAACLFPLLFGGIIWIFPLLLFAANCFFRLFCHYVIH